MQPSLISGFRGFVVVWLGQSVSLIGTSMTRFAFTIWAYEQTQSATVLALVGFFSFAPTVILSPLAGALVDRWNRKVVMMLSDLAAGCATMALLVLAATDNLQIWHLYVAGAFASAFEAFQFPAFSAAITMMIPKKHFARASGMESFAQFGSNIVAPVLAGILLTTVGIGGIMILDIITFIIAVSTILVVLIPQPATTDAGTAARGNLLAESLYGFRYILARPSLLGIQSIFFLANLFGAAGIVLLAPMVLAATGSNELILGTVQSALGLGGLAGGLLLATWGGFRRKVHGVLLGIALSGLLGNILIGIGQGPPLWAVGAFLMMFFIPILNGSNQAIWQAKIPPDLQGRVFAARRLIAQIAGPVSMLVAGFLADDLFEPAMMPGGALAPLFGGLVGTQPGAGIALLFVITGLLLTISGLAGYAVPAIRNIETILPDHDSAPAQNPETPVANDGVGPTPVTS